MISTSLVFAAILAHGPVTPAVTVQRMVAANAQAVRITLIDSALKARAVELVRLELPGGTGVSKLVVSDARGVQTLPLASAAAIAPEWWIVDDAALTPTARAPAATLASILLVDGQRLIGAIAPAIDAPVDDQVIRWSHPRLGALPIAIDRVARIVFDDSVVAPEPAPSGDSVLLGNGDRVTGFVDAIGPDILLSPSTPSGSPKAAAVRIPIDQAAMVQLSNPAQRAAGPTVWLADGSVLATPRLEIDTASLKVTLAPLGSAAGASVELGDLRGIALDAGRLTALASLPLAGFGPTGGRRIAEPPRLRPVGQGPATSPLGADDIELPGPMFAEWNLPAAGDMRIAGWVSLDPDARSWGDCEVVVSAVDAGSGGAVRELARQRVNAAQPVVPINALLAGARTGSRVRIAVEPGEGGPIQDRVTLRRMLLLSAP